MLIQILYILLQIVYINCFLYNKPILPRTGFTYTTDHFQHEMNIYKTNNDSKKYLICLSGSYKLQYSFYIKKCLYDLQPQLANQYEIIVLEKLDKTSILMHYDIIGYITELNKTGIDELILLGFSSGGVVASHVLAGLHHITCAKKIITYDTPFQVTDNLYSFQKNWVYRLDLYLYTVGYSVYNNHYNYVDIKPILDNYDYIYNADVLVKMIKLVHNFDDEKLYELTGFNTDQDEKTQIISISCKYDPIVNKQSQLKFALKHKIGLDKLNITYIEKDVIGHCSDVAFGSDYTKDILYAIGSNRF